MPIDIIIPSPGESITEVTLGAWHKRNGDWVEKDEPLVEIESEKVTLEIPAPESGVLNVTADSGTEKKVGDRIGSIDPKAAKPNGTAGGGPGVSPGRVTDETAKQRTGDGGAPVPPKTSPDHPARSAAAVERATEEAARATSVARKIAQEKGIDLGKLQGTGPSGRIRKSDVLAVSEGGPSSGGPGVSPGRVTSQQGERRTGETPVPPRAIAPAPSIVATSSPGQRAIRREKMSKLRQRIAERLVQAQHNAAMLTTFNEVDCGEMMRLRSLHKEDFEKRWGVGLGFMSFFVKAAVSALQTYPRVNAYIVPPSPSGRGQGEGAGGAGSGGAEIEYHDFIDVSVAVGTEKGLVVPVIRNAELMTFAEIEATIKDFAVRAKAGKLTIDEMTGGTFTISNGGTYGSLNSTPILNPPQSGILGMHAIKKRAVEYPKDSGSIALRPMMYVALSYDHRIVDGAEAVSFLVHIKNTIENPERMLLGL